MQNLCSHRRSGRCYSAQCARDPWGRRCCGIVLPNRGVGGVVLTDKGSLLLRRARWPLKRLSVNSLHGQRRRLKSGGSWFVRIQIPCPGWRHHGQHVNGSKAIAFLWIALYEIDVTLIQLHSTLCINASTDKLTKALCYALGVGAADFGTDDTLHHIRALMPRPGLATPRPAVPFLHPLERCEHPARVARVEVNRSTGNAVVFALGGVHDYPHISSLSARSSCIKVVNLQKQHVAARAALLI